MLTFDELRAFRKEMSQIQLKNLENVDLGAVMSEFIHNSNNKIDGGRRNFPVIKHIMNIIARSVVRSNRFKCFGTGDIMCFIPRNMLTVQKNHLLYFNSIVGLLDNRIEMVGTRGAGFSAKNILCLRVLPHWNRTLKNRIRDKKYRWYFIRSLYGAYIDYCDYSRYVKKKLGLRGLLLYTETPAAAQIIRQVAQKNGITTVCLNHGEYPVSELTRYSMETWGCDYYAVRSKMMVDLVDRMGGFPGKTYIVGIPLYIDNDARKKELDERRHEVNTVVIFLDGEVRREDDCNCEMINIVAQSLKNTEIIVKFHPTSRIRYMESVKERTKQYGITTYCKEEIPLTKLIDNMDMGVCRNSSIFPEIIYSGIPTVLYSKNQVTYKYLNQDIFFADEKEFERQLQRVEDGEIYNTINEICEYICGPYEVKRAHKIFYSSIGW